MFSRFSALRLGVGGGLRCLTAKLPGNPSIVFLAISLSVSRYIVFYGNKSELKLYKP